MVSIIIPSFNRESIILETINSLKSQTYSDWEAIIVDDGSTDNTLQVIKTFSASDHRIKIYERNLLPKGAPVCRNIGLSNATGNFLIFLDSDDLLGPWCLQERINEFKKNPECDFIIFNGAFFSSSMYDSTVLWNRFDERKDIERFLKGEPVWQTSAPIWKASFLKNHHLAFNETAVSSQDWEFHVRALLHEPVYRKINSIPDYFIRRSNNYERISDSHWSENKILKRIELYDQVLKTIPVSFFNKRYKIEVFTLILKQYHYLLKNLKVSFNYDDLRQIKKKLNRLPIRLRLGISYLYFGNKLLLVNFYLYRYFRKICEELFLKKLFYTKSAYRSPLSSKELTDLHGRLKSEEQKTNS